MENNCKWGLIEEIVFMQIDSDHQKLCIARDELIMQY